MMQLQCNGVRLDLPAGAALTFKKTNPLFAFDNLTCERTAEFSLPATPTNNRVLSFANNPAAPGEGMRRKFDAQLRVGVVEKRGYLYVSGFDGGSYSAIFVTGELVGLQAIKDLGKLADIFSSTLSATLGQTTTPSAAGNYATADYKTNGRKSPSVSVRHLVDGIVAQNNLAAVTLPEAAQGLRIFPYTAHGLKERALTFSSSVSDSSQPTTSEPSASYNSVSVSPSSSANLFTTSNAYVSTRILGATRLYNVRQFVPLQDISLTFPSSWPSSLYVQSWEEDYADGVFLGDRSFSKVWQSNHAVVTRTGTELKGRTITIPKGTPFVFVNEDDFQCVQAGGSMTLGYQFGLRSDGLTFAHEIKAKASANPTTGDIVALVDNLPDLNFVELLKAAAAITGTCLNYTDADGVTFDPLNVEEWGVVDLSGKCVKSGKLDRTFGKYAQRNVVAFSPADWISSPLSQVYTIDNDNLTEESTLQKIALEEGNAAYDANGVELVSVESGKEDNGYLIANAGSAQYLERVKLAENANLQALCDASTTARLSFHLSLFEYEQVTAKNCILYNNTKYVWTESTWAANTAVFTLCKCF